MEIYAKAPNKTATYVIGDDGFTGQGFNGKVGWDLDYSGRGLRELKGAELAAIEREADFYRMLHLKESYATTTFKGTAKVGDRLANLIEATIAGSPNIVRLYFDAASGLLIRRDVVPPDPQEKAFVEVYFEDYREVDGIKMAFTIRNVFPRADVMNVFSIEEIKQNVAIDDAKFEKPSTR